MLTFTLVAAAFVSVQVIATYSIPDIPTNMLILMGISNGVYLAGRKSYAAPAGSTTSPASTESDICVKLRGCRRK